jgi:DNA-binding LytR/AlgR family response regulator
MLKLLICDDENAFCSHLESLLFEYQNEKSIEIKTEVFYSGEKLLEYLKSPETGIDIVFLDIEMDGINGVKTGQILREEIGNNTTQIVYISAKDSYALELFQNRPMQFLVKPITKEDIFKVLDTYIKISVSMNTYFEYSSSKSTHKIILKNILYFESRLRKKLIHTTSGEIEFYGGFSDLINNPVLKNFIQINRSLLVNPQNIAEYHNDYLLLVNSEKLIVSRVYLQNVKKHLISTNL